MAPTLDQLLKALADRNHAEWESGPAPPPLSICISRICTACKEGDFTTEEVRLIAENPATARAVTDCFAMMERDEDEGEWEESADGISSYGYFDPRADEAWN